VSISQIPSGWTITRSDERIVVQHVSGSFYAAAKEGDSGIAESILYMLADSLLSAPLSPAHIEDGEEVEVVGYRSGTSGGIYTEGYGLERPEPLMTVAQHQRIVAARASKAAARVEDEREAFEAEATRLGVYTCDFVRYDETTAHCYNRDNGDLITVSVGDYRSATLQDCWKMWQARAALSAPPAAGVPGDSYLESCAAAAKMFEQLAPTPPASEQQRAVVMPDEAMNLLSRAQSEIESLAESVENLGEDLDEEDVSEEVFEARELAGEIGEFLRLNPHLAKGEGV